MQDIPSGTANHFGSLDSEANSKLDSTQPPVLAIKMNNNILKQKRINIIFFSKNHLKKPLLHWLQDLVPPKTLEPHELILHALFS
jgi:hypothetical protein